MMETTPADELSVIEKIFVKSGKIIAVRKWNSGNIHEIDVYLPAVEFRSWSSVQSVKCRISALHYTDYTPALWNMDEKICTLYIDTSHCGQGSVWAKSQLGEGPFHYTKIEAERHYPIGKHLVFLGDQTAIGHFCALQQLAVESTVINGFITFNDVQTAKAFSENCTWLPLETTTGYDDIYKRTGEWIMKHQCEKDDFVFYIVGNAGLIVTSRKLLKTHGIKSDRIKSKGFWH